MTAAVCSEAEFIELFRTHKSASKVAEALSIDVRRVHERRRNLERKHNMRLDAADVRSKQFERYQPYEHKANHQLGLLNGQVIVFSDAHYWPQIRTAAHKALCKLIRELKPRAVICNGDAFDGARISRFPRPGFLDAGPSVIDELRACKERLGEVEEAAGRAKLVWCLGNHDMRFEARLAANAPEYEGIQGFHLKDHFPAWIPAWCCWVNDGTIVSHRWKNGVHATHTNVVNAGVNIITGHLHQLKWTRFNDFRQEDRYGVDTGTLAEPMGPQFINYLEGKMPMWASGFAVLTFKEGRMMMPQLAKKWGSDQVEFMGHIIDVSRE